MRKTVTGAIALLLAACVLSAQEPKWKRTRPINDLPNPYRRDANWAQLPAGMKWGAVIGAEPGPDGNIYVVHRCFENSCAGRSEPPIFKFDPAGKVIGSWGVGTYVFPHGFFVDSQGNVWVSDAQGRDGKGHQVFKYNSDGKLLMTIGTAGIAGDGAENKLREPTDVVTAPNGDIFITEGHTIGGAVNRVSKWSKDGTFIKAWGKTGSAPGDLNVPHTIAIDSRGRLFVGDRANNRIQIFDQDGKFLDEWTEFGRPSGIAIARDDTIYVADSESWGPDEPGWKKGIRIGSARDGSVKYFIEDIESTTEEHSGAEGVGVDREGNVYGAVVRRMMLEKHILVHAQPPQPPPGGRGGRGAITSPRNAYPDRPPADPAMFERGKALYGTNCQFCHGADTRGGDGGPSLLRSGLVLDDQHGELIAPILRDGRPDRGMPKFAMSDEQVADIAAFVHSFRAAGYDESRVKPPSIVTGDAKAGEAYFNAKCTSCHSTSGDLHGLATKIADPKLLQQTWLMPGSGGGGRGRGVPPPVQLRPVTVTLPSGEKVEGTLDRVDDFVVSLTDADGAHRSFRTEGDTPKVEIHDPLQPHRELLRVYTDADIHNVTAFLVTLK